MNTLPKISVIVCTRNGEKCIKDCLDALVTQDYPKTKYEIIVVNDGSTDNTEEIVSKYPVKIITHSKNKGTYASRNTGLRKATGKIIAYTDDDCIPDKEWLKNIVKPYANVNVVAVGGITKSYSDKSLTERYMAEIGYGDPAPVIMGKSKNPLYRFYYYVIDSLNPEIRNIRVMVDVFAIYTLNASYRRKILIDIGGWDENFKFGGDLEISARIHKVLKNKRIVCNPEAKVVHKHRVLFFKFMKEIFNRTTSRVQYYKKYDIFPPIYPFPIFGILLSLLALFVIKGYSVFVIPCLPLFLYFWYPLKFLKTGKYIYLAFPYMQFLHEAITTFGMIKTYIPKL